MKTVRALTADEVTFTLECLPEDIDPADSFQFPEDVELVRVGVADGNEWAWFCAKVTARWGEFEGVDYLGGCSYSSEADFRGDAYFSDMKAEALSQLNAEVARVAALVCPLVQS